MLKLKTAQYLKKKRLNNYGLHGRIVRIKSLLSKKNIAAQSRFTKLYLNKQQDF